MEREIFLLLLGVLGLVAFVQVMQATNRHMTRTAAAWTRGGAVAIAVGGIFALLLALANG